MVSPSALPLALLLLLLRGLPSGRSLPQRQCAVRNLLVLPHLHTQLLTQLNNTLLSGQHTRVQKDVHV
jgi:hypothetical protein